MQQERDRARRLDVVVLACAVSAGIHTALVPEHLEEGLGAGLGFIVAAALAAALAVVLTFRPTQIAVAGTAALFVGLIASYALVVTNGLPVLHPEVEGVELLALVTKAVEAVGLVAAVTLLQRPQLPFAFQPKGTRA